MGLFSRLFGTVKSKEPQPDIRFGRYSDSYKANAQYDAWDASLKEFEAKNYKESYRQFFTYLNDPSLNNVQWKETGDVIEFELVQGSKKIFGSVDSEKLKVEALVVKCNDLSNAFMRKLLDKNFNLKYGRFALNDANEIVMKFETFMLDGSPYKLYYALKEVASNADKQDDLLADEFDMLEMIETGKVEPLSESEKETKYNFIQNEINKTFTKVDSLDQERFSGGITYALLHLAYKLDYLIAPEGYMMDNMERIHGKYFANDNKTTAQKSDMLRKEFTELSKRSKEDFYKEFYRVTSTFGITTPKNHDLVAGFIGDEEKGELRNMKWYIDNNHDDLAIAIPGYIAGYCMFNYAIPQPDRELFHLFFEISETQYFKDLGFTFDYYDLAAKKLNKRAILDEIDSIVSSNKRKYPKCNPNTSILDYSSLAKFSQTYMRMIRDLDLSKA